MHRYHLIGIVDTSRIHNGTVTNTITFIRSHLYRYAERRILFNLLALTHSYNIPALRYITSELRLILGLLLSQSDMAFHPTVHLNWNVISAPHMRLTGRDHRPEVTADHAAAPSGERHKPKGREVGEQRWIWQYKPEWKIFPTNPQLLSKHCIPSASQKEILMYICKDFSKKNATLHSLFPNFLIILKT